MSRVLPFLPVVFGLVLMSCTPSQSAEPSSARVPGALISFGDGSIETYADLNPDGTPGAIGIQLSQGALENLPSAITDGNRCFDANADGEIDQHAECSAWHERVIPLPAEISRREDVPFKWVLLNWNNHGHIPPGVWDVPHFDIHFYTEPIENIFALQRGTCGPEMLRCDQFEVATRPVPAEFMHADYTDVGAAAPAMGNHLVDPTAPEFHGEPFTRSWIYGAYDGRVIFYEEMLALNFLQNPTGECFPIKTTPEVAESGYYPNSVCTRKDAESGNVTVSLEEFTYREAAMSAG